MVLHDERGAHAVRVLKWRQGYEPVPQWPRTMGVDAKSPWSFRPARDEDADELTALHQLVFGRTISRQQWLWKLRTQPGPVPNVWVAEADGKLVFQYAGIPIRFRHRASECWGMIDVDTMTHPDYRRRGLLTQGGTWTYAEWRKADIAFTVGLPNEQWGSRTSALGWARLGELRWWVRWLDPLRMLAAKAGLRWRRSFRSPTTRRRGELEIAPIDDAAPFDELWDRTGGDGVVRNAAWFRWRYLEAVPRWSVLGAWAASRLVGGLTFHLDAIPDCPSGLVGEVLATSLDTMRLLLLRACEEVRSMGAARVAMLIQPGSMLEEAALAAGFLPHQWVFSVEAVDLGGGLPRTSQFHGGDFDVV